MRSATPIYDRLVLDRAGDEARAFVRLRLNACPTCAATPGDPCTTRTGNPTSAHKGRRWR